LYTRGIPLRKAGGVLNIQRLVHSHPMNRRPIVGFDGLQFARPATGSGQYALNLWRELTRRDNDPCDYALLAPDSDRSAQGNAAKLAWEQAGLSLAARRKRVDLVHVPYFSAPLVRTAPQVLTIHDVIPLALPQYARSRRMQLYLSMVTHAARRARCVITDSAYSRDDIVRLLGIPNDRVFVTLLGVSEQFAPVASFADEEALDRLRAKYQLHRPFVLNVGGFDVRKRLDQLIRGFAIASESLHDTYDLVIVGNPHTGNVELYPPVEPLIQSLGLTDRVRLVGFVPEEDKRDLYRATEAFAFTSEYEGFGLDPLEAMACGAPVICSNRTSLPEVVGDAAVLVEPEADAIGAALVTVLSSPELRANLALRGRERAKTFTWKRTADATVAVYHKVLGLPVAQP
jgi:glycosyltransferase involved in cell wall biosynthesis